MALITQGKTNWKFLAVVVVLAAVVGGGVWWYMVKNEDFFTKVSENAGLEQVATAKHIILSNKEVDEILSEFANKKTVSFNDTGAAEILSDALAFKSANLEIRVQELINKFKELAEGIEDAPDMRSWATQRTKICLAESIISNDLESATQRCGYEPGFIFTANNVDDLTADAQVIPFFLNGYAYYYKKDYPKADYYLNQIKLHYNILKGIKYIDLAADYLKLYNKIYNKAMEVSLNIIEDETAGWQTYRNEEYGFEIKYPSEIKWFEGNFVFIGQLPPLEKGTNLEARQLGTRVGFLKSCPIKNASLVVINGINFYKTDSIVSGDLGSALEQKYCAVRDNKVYELNIDLGYRFGELPNFNIERESKIFNQMLSTFRFIEKVSQCSPVDFPGYESAKVATGTVAYELNVDLNNDGKKEIVRVYKDSEQCGARPNMVKIFSGTENCPKEEFSHEFAGENAIFSAPEFVPNFLGDGRGAVAITGISTGCGSGYTQKLHFLTWQGGKFPIIEGPSGGGSGCQGWPLKLDGRNGLATRIISVEAKWAENGSDYCCGCARRLQFVVYNWDGEKYVRTLAGITQNKYFSETVDEIIKKEPVVLNY